MKTKFSDINVVVLRDGYVFIQTFVEGEPFRDMALTKDEARSVAERILELVTSR